jgi:hypothetical protein
MAPTPAEAELGRFMEAGWSCKHWGAGGEAATVPRAGSLSPTTAGAEGGVGLPLEGL